MKYNLKIFTQIFADDYGDSIEATYPCKYSLQDGNHRLKYTDDEAGFTVVKISPECDIEIRRKNSFTILLKKDFTHSTDCETPYGSIPMSFTLLEASHTLSEEGGTVEYTSRVHIDGEPQTNKVTMLLIPDERNEKEND